MNCANCGGAVSGHGPVPRNSLRYCMRPECQQAYSNAYEAQARTRRDRVTTPIPQRRAALPPIGEMIADDDGSRVQCHICGEFYASLARHSLRTHGVPGDTYRERFGLTRKHSLDSPATQAANRARAIKQGSRSNLTGEGNLAFRGRPTGTAARVSERILRHAEGKARNRSTTPEPGG